MPKSLKKPESAPPSPADLMESLRDLGYTLHSALADLLDNSLAAQATRIRVIVEPSSPAPHIVVLDDGQGMTEKRLAQAMRMAAMGPLTPRGTTDLGRFGLGMKTASLSQGRCLTVITKQLGDKEPSVRRWDLAHVRKADAWELLLEPTELAQPYIDAINRQGHGTAIVIEQLDRVSFLHVPPAEVDSHLAAALEAIRSHLAMVFHRFILEDRLEIRLGEPLIQPWDPYLTGFSTALASEKLVLPGDKGVIHVAPFVLPHHSRLTNEQHERGAGPLGWNAHQGFYIYRGRRLIVPGTWLNLNLKKEEHYKLARIQVDLPNTMDTDWQLNVMKSHVAAPSLLRDDFRRIASDVRRQASDVYRVRGERQVLPRTPQDRFVWKRETVRTGVRFRVDRAHPVIHALSHGGCEHEKMLADAIALIESTVPVAAMLQEPQKAIDGSVQNEPPIELDALVDLSIHAEQHFIRTGKNPAEARELVLSCEPFARFRQSILDRIRERTSIAGPATQTEVP